MSKADEFNKAWDLGMQGDFSLVDALYHPDYITVDHRTGNRIDIEADKELINQVKDMVTIGPCRVIFESSDFLCLHRYLRFTEEEPQYNGVITAITYQENKIFRQESSVQTLNYDPSCNQDWSWSDFE
ncbi:MAG: hypothetical protein ACO3LN_17380 [bacterium]